MILLTLILLASEPTEKAQLGGDCKKLMEGLLDIIGENADSYSCSIPSKDWDKEDDLLHG